jgi:hypothetical protein
MASTLVLYAFVRWLLIDVSQFNQSTQCDVPFSCGTLHCVLIVISISFGTGRREEEGIMNFPKS